MKEDLNPFPPTLLAEIQMSKSKSSPKQPPSTTRSTTTTPTSSSTPAIVTTPATINVTPAIAMPKAKPVRRPRNPTGTIRRSSAYRGVTRHRWTGRFEAHLWDKDVWIQNKKGKQVYLGCYDEEEEAAQTYDLAALKYWGPATILNFPASTYVQAYKEMQTMTREEYLASLRRRSSGFSRGTSKYRGVARHHQRGRWEARIGQLSGNKYLYLGTFNTEEEAALAYDRAAIKFRGPNVLTNFSKNLYTNYPLQPTPGVIPTLPPSMPHLQSIYRPFAWSLSGAPHFLQPQLHSQLLPPQQTLPELKSQPQQYQPPLLQQYQQSQSPQQQPPSNLCEEILDMEPLPQLTPIEAVNLVDDMLAFDCMGVLPDPVDDMLASDFMVDLPDPFGEIFATSCTGELPLNFSPEPNLERFSHEKQFNLKDLFGEEFDNIDYLFQANEFTGVSNKDIDTSTVHGVGNNNHGVSFGHARIIEGGGHLDKGEGSSASTKNVQGSLARRDMTAASSSQLDTVSYSYPI